MGFWDSPIRAPVARARASWLTRALERATATTTTTTTRSTSAEAEASDEAIARENDANAREEELRHLRRHVDALSRACADAEAKAEKGAEDAATREAILRENETLRGIDAERDRAETRAKAAEARANAARDALVNGSFDTRRR